MPTLDPRIRYAIGDCPKPAAVVHELARLWYLVLMAGTLDRPATPKAKQAAKTLAAVPFAERTDAARALMREAYQRHFGDEGLHAVNVVFKLDDARRAGDDTSDALKLDHELALTVVNQLLGNELLVTGGEVTTYTICRERAAQAEGHMDSP